MNKFKCILQNDETDCGPACLAAIFRKYGLKVTIAKIRDIAGTDRQGTNAHGLDWDCIFFLPKISMQHN